MKKILFSMVMGVLITQALFTTPALAKQWRYKIINTKELYELYKKKADYILFDALSPIHYAVDHIAGAKNIPMGQVMNNGQINPNMPSDKSAKIIFYCAGPKCIYSKNNAEDAIDAGYTNVWVYEEGTPAWKRNRYPIEKGDLKLPKIKYQIITPVELNENLSQYLPINLLGKTNEIGYIKGSQIIPLTEFMGSFTEIPKNKKIVLYDLHSHLQNIAAQFLVAKGYNPKNLYVLKGGLVGWNRAGLPIMKD
jgi:rhodanese-related sulfurtransferase